MPAVISGSIHLSTVGGFTALWSAVIALMQKDLKLMLAFSTNTILGILTLLLGIGTETALAAAILFILAHAFYKAALFMVVGNIDKATGTRDIRVLYGLKAVLIFSFASGLIAALSKAGIPPLLGFLSKEYAYKAGLGSPWHRNVSPSHDKRCDGRASYCGDIAAIFTGENRR